MPRPSAREPFVGCTFVLTVLPDDRTHVEMRDSGGKAMAEGMVEDGLEGVLLHALMYVAKL